MSTFWISIEQAGALRGRLQIECPSFEDEAVGTVFVTPLEGVGCNVVQPGGRLSPPSAQSLSSIFLSAVMRTRTESLPHGSIQTVPFQSFITRRLFSFANIV